MKNFLLFFLILFFLIPIQYLGAESRGVNPPGTFEEIVNTFKEIGREVVYGIPRGLSLVWHKVMDPVTNFFKNKVLPKIKFYINRAITKIKNWLLFIIRPKAEKEIKERRPIIEKELEKETKEIKEDTIWEDTKNWFKDLF
ncbi:MAG: hypothetical protein ACOC1P_03445 [Minisyncoccales bacterium]